MILIRRESIIKSDQKSKVGEAWFTNCRIIGCFDFESKAKLSESRIKLVRALVFTGYEYLKNLGITTCFFGWIFLKNSFSKETNLYVWYTPNKEDLFMMVDSLVGISLNTIFEWGLNKKNPVKIFQLKSNFRKDSFRMNKDDGNHVGFQHQSQPFNPFNDSNW